MRRLATPPKAVLVRAAALLLAAGLVFPGASRSAHAAGPQLTLKCFGNKARYSFSCWTWGNNFAGGEQVVLHFTVTHQTMPKVQGKRPTESYARTVKTNAFGAFVGTPKITFRVVKTHSSYEVAVTGIGSLKDRGTTSLASIGT